MIWMWFRICFWIWFIWFWMWAFIWLKTWALTWLRMWACVWRRMRSQNCLMSNFFQISWFSRTSGHPWFFHVFLFLYSSGTFSTPDFFECLVFSRYYDVPEFLNTTDFLKCPALFDVHVLPELLSTPMFPVLKQFCTVLIDFVT